MMKTTDKIIGKTTFVAMVLSLLIAVLPPFAFFFFGYQHQSAVLATEAEMNGLLVSQIVNASPEYWRYEHHRLEEVISSYPARTVGETRRILDPDGAVIAQYSAGIQEPTITRSHFLYDSGNIVGRIEISRSLRLLIGGTILTGLLSFVFGFSVYAVLKIFPLRALAKTLQVLYDEKERSKAILNNMPDIAWLKDKECRYVAINKAFENATGQGGEEVVGKTDRDLWPAELADKYVVDDMDVMEGRERKIKEESMMDRLGRTILVETIKTPLYDNKGNVIGTTGISRDISERKKAEERIRMLNAELEQKVEERTKQLLDAQEELVRKEKLAILGQLAGSVGHEIRNPLGVISNAVYFLISVLPTADETVKEYLEMIKSEVDNSQRILNDLLDFSRTKTPHKEPVHISELINGSIGKCHIPENVSVQIDISDALPQINVDILQMSQVLQNLVTNAVQAMPAGGALRISAKIYRDFVEIFVADSGEGILPENMPKLYQPLFTTKAKGIGLGLALCKRLAEANGGRIDVESAQGKGTAFTITLPAEAEI